MIRDIRTVAPARDQMVLIWDGTAWRPATLHADGTSWIGYGTTRVFAVASHSYWLPMPPPPEVA